MAVIIDSVWGEQVVYPEDVSHLKSVEPHVSGEGTFSTIQMALGCLYSNWASFL